MNLRTITFWVLYDPMVQVVIASRKLKKDIERIHHPAGCVVVKVKGHYLPRRAEQGAKP